MSGASRSKKAVQVSVPRWIAEELRRGDWTLSANDVLMTTYGSTVTLRPVVAEVAWISSECRHLDHASCPGSGLLGPVPVGGDWCFCPCHGQPQ